MAALINQLANLIDDPNADDGLRESPARGVYCLKLSNPDELSKKAWRASLGVIAQGSKEIVLGRTSYYCEAGSYVAVPFDLPVTSRIIAASPDKPFLSLQVGFDSQIVSEIDSELTVRDSQRPFETQSRAFFVAKASDQLLDAAIRLAKLYRTPEDAPVIGPLALKEMFYHLLKGPDGAAIRQFVRAGSSLHRVSTAIHKLRSELAVDIDITSLADDANMSRSAFFKHFKDVTAMSPIQYQKRLRLLEARRLMTEEHESAEGAAFRVGYNSPSQFSREYARMFGDPPLRSAFKIIKAGQPMYEY